MRLVCSIYNLRLSFWLYCSFLFEAAKIGKDGEYLFRGIDIGEE